MEQRRRAFEGVRIFSATSAAERNALGERLTRWLQENPAIEVVDQRVLQSSDERFHCLTIVLFYAARDSSRS